VPTVFPPAIFLDAVLQPSLIITFPFHLPMGFYLPIRELPKPPQETPGRPLPEQNVPIPLDDCRQRFNMGNSFLSYLEWISFRVSRDPPLAEISHRAAETLGVLGGADRGAEVHEGLVERTGVSLRDQGFREMPEKIFGTALCRVAENGEGPREDSLHVPVKDRRFLVKSDGEDGPRRIFPNARQTEETFPVVRNLSTEMI